MPKSSKNTPNKRLVDDESSLSSLTSSDSTTFSSSSTSTSSDDSMPGKKRKKPIATKLKPQEKSKQADKKSKTMATSSSVKRKATPKNVKSEKTNGKKKTEKDDKPKNNRRTSVPPRAMSARERVRKKKESNGKAKKKEKNKNYDSSISSSDEVDFFSEDSSTSISNSSEENGQSKTRNRRSIARKQTPDSEISFRIPKRNTPSLLVDIEKSDIEDEESLRIEKILSRRELKDTPGAFEYLVKWKNSSYLHCEWLNETYFNSPPILRMRLLRFIAKINRIELEIGEDEEGAFNPDFLQVDRVIDMRTVDNELYYLVKWKSLSYSECTWERECDVNDDEKINLYKNCMKMPENAIENSAIETKRETKKVTPRMSFEEIKTSREYENRNELRDYQLEGLNWLFYCWCNRTNSILADEMGLGKTVQAISVLDEIKRQTNSKGPFLIVAPLSTLPQWKREFESWTKMNVVMFHGSLQDRDLIRKYEFYYPDLVGKAAIAKNVFKFDALITSYEMFRADRAFLTSIQWRYVIVDEAHKLKNVNSKILNDMRLLHTDHLTLLTGTPLQNNTQELWTLLNFIDKDRFASLDEFMKDFGELTESTQVVKLQEILHGLLLRRMKDDVEKGLAPKEETLIEVELTTLQKKYYRAIFEHNISFLRKGCSNSNAPSLLNIMMELRKCCNHPYLIRGVEEKDISPEENEGKKLNRDETFHRLVHASGKLVLIDKLLPRLKEEKHKVLIFSQMVRVLDILAEYLEHKGYLFERLDGRVRGNDRQQSIDRFCKKDSDRFVFLLCTRAGGLGINLQVADTVIIFDSDWNPQNDVQAMARAHRIGQQSLVKVYRLITRNTYERFMFERASKKLGLDQAVLQKMKTNDDDDEEDEDEKTISGLSSTKQLSSKEVDSLLKHGAYGCLAEQTDEAERKFVEADIEQILEHSTTTIVHGVSETSLALSSFSKASFVSDQTSAGLDVDDPDFWQKLMPDIPDYDPNVIKDGITRNRKITQRYDFDENEDEDDDMREPNGGDENVSDDEYDYVSEQGFPRKKFRPWSATERNRLKCTLNDFGFGRWMKIREVSGLRRFSLSEVAAFTKAMVAKCLNGCPPERIPYFAKLITGVDLEANGYKVGTVLTSEHFDSTPHLTSIFPNETYVYEDKEGKFVSTAKDKAISPSMLVGIRLKLEEESAKREKDAEKTETKTNPMEVENESETKKENEVKEGVKEEKEVVKEGKEEIKEEVKEEVKEEIKEIKEDVKEVKEDVKEGKEKIKEDRDEIVSEAAKETIETQFQDNVKSEFVNNVEREDDKTKKEQKLEVEKEVKTEPVTEKEIEVKKSETVVVNPEPIKRISATPTAAKSFKISFKFGAGKDKSNLLVNLNEPSPSLHKEKDQAAPTPTPQPKVIVWKDGNVYRSTTIRYDDEPSLNDEYFKEFVQKNGVKLINRLCFMSSLYDELACNSHAYDHLTSTDKPANWWTVEHDRDLFIGSLKWGFCRYDELKVDPELCFNGILNTNAKENDTTKPNEDLTKEFPSNKILTSRIKKLFRLYMIRTDDDDNQNNDENAERKRETFSKKERRRENAIVEWNKRERHNFYIALVSYGLPKDNDWERFLIRAKLPRKTPELALKYYSTLIEQCKMIEEQRKKEKTKQKESVPVISSSVSAPPFTNNSSLDVTKENVTVNELIEEKSNGIMNDSMNVELNESMNLELNASMNVELNESMNVELNNSVNDNANEKTNPKRIKFVDDSQKNLTAKSNKDNDEGFKVEEESQTKNEDKPNDEAEKPKINLTIIQSRRVLRRIVMFQHLQKILSMPHEEIEHILLERSRRTAQLPTWWTPGPHDEALLHLADKYGVGNWDKALRDEDFPLWDAIDAYLNDLEAEGRINKAQVLATTTKKGVKKDGGDEKEKDEKEDEEDESMLPDVSDEDDENTKGKKTKKADAPLTFLRAIGINKETLIVKRLEYAISLFEVAGFKSTRRRYGDKKKEMEELRELKERVKVEKAERKELEKQNREQEKAKAADRRLRREKEKQRKETAKEKKAEEERIEQERKAENREKRLQKERERQERAKELGLDLRPKSKNLKIDYGFEPKPRKWTKYVFNNEQIHQIDYEYWRATASTLRFPQEVEFINNGVRLPIRFKTFSVLSLGEIVPRSAHFHNELYLYPKGFHVHRLFASVIQANTEMLYDCEVRTQTKQTQEHNDAVLEMFPLFVVSFIFPSEIEFNKWNEFRQSHTLSHSIKTFLISEGVRVVYEGDSPDNVWDKVKADIALVYKNNTEMEQLKTISGNCLFGLDEGAVKSLLQMLPNVETCLRYRFQYPILDNGIVAFRPLPKENLIVIGKEDAKKKMKEERRKARVNQLKMEKEMRQRAQIAEQNKLKKRRIEAENTFLPSQVYGVLPQQQQQQQQQSQLHQSQRVFPQNFPLPLFTPFMPQGFSQAFPQPLPQMYNNPPNDAFPVKTSQPSVRAQQEPVFSEKNAENM